jgi:hypothetical protein
LILAKGCCSCFLHPKRFPGCSSRCNMASIRPQPPHARMALIVSLTPLHPYSLTHELLPNPPAPSPYQTFPKVWE